MRIVIACCLWILSMGSVISSPLSDALNRCVPLINDFVEAQHIPYSEPLDLAEHCPDAVLTFHEDEYSPLLSKELFDTASLNELHDIRGLLNDAHSISAPVSRPDSQLIERIQSELTLQVNNEGPSWWDEFITWLKALLKQETPQQEDSWLIKFLENVRLPQWLGEVIYYTSVAIIILLALIVVLFEIRNSRFRFVKNDKTHTHSSAGLSYQLQRTPMTFEAIEKLPTEQQPSALLSLSVHRLIELGFIPNNLSLTNIELQQRLLTKQKELVAPFQTIIRLAETVIYGNKNINADALEEIKQATQTLVNYQVAVHAG